MPGSANAALVPGFGSFTDVTPEFKMVAALKQIALSEARMRGVGNPIVGCTEYMAHAGGAIMKRQFDAMFRNISARFMARSGAWPSASG
ncbi:hypothetical protein ACIP1U_17995 [Cupriavidus sp. NPDC089707]|uniref:hypothetical protein n=1 Tax=Cupriavidus sp. NPDC089707 TaxID=3363963 RepID=UPI0037F4D8AD